ncbi:MAG: hypothetical protein J6Q85_04275 [Clostridia bacterium]|nr:hypothetical protein [Clostridia bacterium]
MVVTFHGDDNFTPSQKYKTAMLEFFRKLSGGKPLTFLVNYELPFMLFAIDCIKEYKTVNGAKTVFVSPYSKYHYDKFELEHLFDKFDEVVFSNTNHLHGEFLKGQCNAHMMRDADCTVAYIDSDESQTHVLCRSTIAYGKSVYYLSECGVKEYNFRRE